MFKRILAILLILSFVLSFAFAEELKLNSTKIQLGVKDKYTLSATVLPSDTVQSVKYTTSNKKVATVSAAGVITAKKAGTAKITAKTANGLSAVCTVKVMKAPSKVKLNSKKATLNVGKTYQLKATLPKKTWSTITFSSSNSAVATVNASGLVTAVAPGTATITAKTGNGKKATCKVTVKGAAVELSVYLGKSLKQTANSLSLKRDSTDYGSDYNYYYSNKAVIIGGHDVNCFRIILSGSNYTLYGVAVGMTAAEARAALSRNGCVLDYSSGSMLIYRGPLTDSKLCSEEDVYVNLKNGKVTSVETACYGFDR